MDTAYPMEAVKGKIYLIRGHKVMLSADLAVLYGIEPRVLVQAVKRNIERFPEDFMFQHANQEVTGLKSQIVISSWGGSASCCTICIHGTGHRHAVKCTQ